MKTLTVCMLILGFVLSLKAQNIAPEIKTVQDEYLAKQKVIGKTFSGSFYPNYAKVHCLSEIDFTRKIDSARAKFSKLLIVYQNRLDSAYVIAQRLEIKLYFDKLLIEYPNNHEVYTGSSNSKYPLIMERVAGNQSDFNNLALLNNDDFKAYVKSFLEFQIDRELKKQIYNGRYNQRLDAMWNILPRYFTNKKCLDFWQFDYLITHIEHNGMKGTARLYSAFKSTCSDTTYLNKLKNVYEKCNEDLKDHEVREYKNLGNYGLDIHIFMPDSIKVGSKRPVMVYFHGGSWSEGQPAWHFDACRKYARKGWVACAVEYRIYGNQGILPFAAVMDARSAIRWLREHGKEFNIDTNRIVATGNSAGGHLVLAAALANRWNEKSDHLKYSPVPNVLLANSGVYDLTDEKTSWIRKDLKNKDLVKEISPNYLVKKQMPPTLIIHSTGDQNVPYVSAKKFADEMATTGNQFEFKSIENGHHFIFDDPKYTPQVFGWRKDFLLRLGYPDNDGE